MGCSSSAAADAADADGSRARPQHSVSSVASTTSFSSRYDLHELLGEGGFARVYTSRRKDIGEDSAVKIIDLAAGTSHKAAVLRGRADDEVAIWKRIGRHEHCVAFFEAFVEGGAYHMVMERCGESLLERLEPVRTGGAAGLSRVFREMLFGAQHMHSRDVCHRDLKPANLLFGGPMRETVKLCDFGLATVVPKTGIALRAKGSPSYMSPETLAETCITTKADVWSLGVTAYVALYNRLPYEIPGGDNRDAIRAGEPAPCFAVLPGVEPAQQPGSAEELCRLLLSRDQNTRCTAEEALHHAFVWQAEPKKGPDRVGDIEHETSSTALGDGSSVLCLSSVASTDGSLSARTPRLSTPGSGCV